MSTSNKNKKRTAKKIAREKKLKREQNIKKNNSVGRNKKLLKAGTEITSVVNSMYDQLVNGISESMAILKDVQKDLIDGKIDIPDDEKKPLIAEMTDLAKQFTATVIDIQKKQLEISNQKDAMKQIQDMDELFASIEAMSQDHMKRLDRCMEILEGKMSKNNSDKLRKELNKYRTIDENSKEFKDFVDEIPTIEEQEEKFKTSINIDEGFVDE